MSDRHVRLSKFLSFALRHQPDAVGLTVDARGWADIDELLAVCAREGRATRREELLDVVATNPKQRFSLSDDGQRIRANQGHSIDVDLGLVAVEPPSVLYHGTVATYVDSIRTDGLVPGGRNHVHLSEERETAVQVGGRRGKPVVLVIDAERMAAADHVFYRSVNGVWLTATVPVEYLRFP